MGKGIPDNSRYVHIYTRSPDQKNYLEDLASQAGVPLSKYLLAIVEEGLNLKTESESKFKLLEESRTISDENKHLREEIKLKNLMLDKYESELKRLRNADFIDDSYKGRRQHDPNLIAALKRGPIRDHRLMEVLNVREPEDIKALGMQLEDLESYGIIAKVPTGWKWIA